MQLYRPKNDLATVIRPKILDSGQHPSASSLITELLLNNIPSSHLPPFKASRVDGHISINSNFCPSFVDRT